METARPLVDIYVHDWISSQSLKREWFFEERDGNCRLMDPFVKHLSGTAQMWQRAIAPHAEWIARTLWKGRTPSPRWKSLATPLTQARRRIAQGGDPSPRILSGPKPVKICLTCGGRLKRKHRTTTAVDVLRKYHGQTYCKRQRLDGSLPSRRKRQLNEQ